MTDILLTHSNHLYHDSRQVQKMQPYPPLQTLIAAACLREKGFSVALFDSTLISPKQGWRDALAHHKPKLAVICEDSFNFISKMCLKRNRDTAFSLARIAREFDIPIAVHGPDSSNRALDYLTHGADFVIIGEIENTLVDLATHILGEDSGNIALIPGLCYLDRDRGKIHLAVPRELEGELDTFPQAAWDLVNIASYRRVWLQAHGSFCLNLATSRGCPYRCNWCAKPVFGHTYRFKTAGRAAEEMRHLKHSYAPDSVWFADDIFALSPQWIEEFADGINRLAARIPFTIQSRCDLITPKTAAALQRAGCIEVWLGAESGSQRVLDAMGKEIRVNQIGAARNLLKSHGMRAGYFLQFGYPGEAWDDIQDTIHMVRETAPDDVGISVAYPLPGTTFYNGVAARMNTDYNWLESGDLSVVFRAPYPSDFYAALHDALHLEVNILNGRSESTFDRTHLEKLWTHIQAGEPKQAFYHRGSDGTPSDSRILHRRG